MLEQETDSASKGHNRDVSRINYDFVFLRQEDFSLLPEYVLRIVPKRKEKSLILGNIWSPSIWIKDIHITLQFAEVNEMWISVSIDAIATVRLLGPYTLAALLIEERR